MMDKESATSAEKEKKSPSYSEIVRTARKLCHDLNQPMQTISGYSDLLAMGIPKEDPKYAKILKIQEAVGQVNKITGQLMNLMLRCKNPD
ncbi:hypothetical protein DENIS_1170 [Desulfonema ishimotonii]|uniref:histidine kinase n=1 Tax=Desulfonema ishimotonii TaxID=45657 RepID=A0A401FTC7_9BACT|nr:histidine kinase dimerization/phospho-acceptor domain-containing protein [Desulfonema ishimotonii]GBC60219.1 hypothetical protein DENIS_1170 [Desulfonema ishimotonii]